MLLLTALMACCTPEDAVLTAPESPWTARDEVWSVSLDSLLASEHSRDLGWSARGGEHLTVGVQSGELYAIPEAGWTGSDWVEVTATPERCGRADTLRFDLGVGALHGPCATLVRYRAQGSPDTVALAGAFSDWEQIEMTQVEGGEWEVELPLAPGAYPYKIVEKQGNAEAWTCNPDEPRFQCDDGYNSGTWDHCTLEGGGCNSLLVAYDCAIPRLLLTESDLDREGGSLDLSVAWQPALSGASPAEVTLSLDGAPLLPPEGWSGAAPLHLSLDDLSAGRHTVRLSAIDSAGVAAEPIYFPFWSDGRSWDQGLLYYAFVDRYDDGDSARNASEGTSHDSTDYRGGDWAGTLSRLDELEALGVTALWITAPLDNPSSAWGNKCGATFSGYHGYWPASDTALEEHFGDTVALRALIDGAHARGIRVVVDWVGNHVHEEHPLAGEHPEWFHDPLLCDENGHWDSHPLDCWFDSFLPDFDYSQPEVIEHRVRAAVDFAKEWEIDGFRVDAVKHMPHPVYANLTATVAEEIEHRSAGGDEDFYTVGETFDGDRSLIASYVGETMLDAQFDFPLYFSVRGAFAEESVSLRDLEAARVASSEAFGDAVMSVFLGNHDVERFITVADAGAWGMCADGSLLAPALPPSSERPYLQLRLAWTWLLTHDGLPLVYYGDDIGLPGHNDPDNRQFMRFDSALSSEEAGVREHLRRLGAARLDYPQLAKGSTLTWWEEDSVFAWVRASEEGSALILINRSDTQRTLSNGLTWAGLPQSGSWIDILTDEVLTSHVDNLSVSLAPMQSRVLIPRE